MAFLANFVVALAFIVIGELFRPKPKIENAKPSSLGDFQFPTADQTRVIPVFWGTCKFKGPNTVYFGDLEIKPIIKKVKTGLFSSQKVLQGNKYYLTVQLTWGWGYVDEFVRMEADDTPVKIKNLVTTADYWRFDMDDPSHMDDGDPKNGLSGPVVVYRGSVTQPANAKLNALWAEVETTPYLHLCYSVLEHCYIGNSDRPPTFSMVLRRTPNLIGLTGGKENIDGDAQVPVMCYEIMTNRLWGRKINPLLINTASFVAAAETLYSERLGISMLVDNATTANDLMADFLRHVDGVIYPDPEDGRYTFALARADYDIETLEIYDDNDIADEDFEFSRMSWDETKNTIIVNYTDRSRDFNVVPAQYQDLANISVRHGAIDPETIDFLGFTNKTNGLFAAQRAAKTRSSPLVRASFTTTRKGYKLRPASVFKMVKAGFGINELVMRVIEISYGTLDDPRIRITAVEDIFAPNGNAYLPPQDSQWTPPVGEVEPVVAQALFEAPYHLLGVEERRLGVVATPATLSDIGFDAWQNNGSGPYEFGQRVPSFTPSGVLVSTYPATTPAVDATGFVLTDEFRLDQLESINDDELYAGANIALIRSSAGDEWIAYKTVAGNTISGIVRAIFHSVPLTHPAGGRVWFVSDGAGQLRDTAYGSNLTVSAKLLPYNLKGTLDIADATAMSKTLTQLAWKPYPAANLKVDGSDSDFIIAGDATVTWNIRDRITQYASGQIVAQSAGNVTAVPEGGYTLKVYINSVLKRTVNITSGPYDSFNYTTAMRIADEADLTKTVQFGIASVNGAYSSAERMSQVVYMRDANPLSITTVYAPIYTVGVPYSLTLTASGGLPPYAWSHVGTLPPGLSRTGNTISGTPTTAGAYTPTFKVTDSYGVEATRLLYMSDVGDQYAKLNAADIGAYLTLSNNDLTVTASMPSPDWQMVRATISKDTDNHYYEVRNDTNGAVDASLIVGWVLGSQALDTYPGEIGVDGWGMDANRVTPAPIVYNNGGSTGTSQTTIGPGGYVYVAVRVSEGKAWFKTSPSGAYYGGGDPVANTSPSATFTPGAAIYPAIAERSTGQAATLNAGAAAFNGAVPAGFNPGWYNMGAFVRNYLLHLNGTNGSTVFPDVTGKAWSAIGTAAISTAQSVFGGASLRVSGSTTCISTPAHADANFGTGDFTISLKLRFDTTVGAGRQNILSNYQDSGAGFTLALDNAGKLCFNCSGDGIDVQGVTVLAPATWYEAKVTRKGTNLRIYIDGVIDATATDSQNINSTAGLCIGALGSGIGFGMVGYIDEVLIVKGAALWDFNHSRNYTAYADA